MNFQTFKTNKRNWLELANAVNWNKMIPVQKEDGIKIAKAMRRFQTDGVIIEHKGKKIPGTINGYEKFIPFKKDILTPEENREIKEKLLVDN
jgi:hypothetical protein